MAQDGSRVTELRRIPRAPIELTEAELLKAMNGVLLVEDGEALYEKLSRALTVESGPGGSFYDGGKAA